MPGFLNRQSVDAPLWRRVLSVPSLVSLALALGALSFLIFRFDVDLGKTWALVRAANIGLVAAAAAVHYTNFLFRGVAWSILLRNAEGPAASAPGVFYCAELILLGWCTNSVAWMRLGDAYRAYLYSNEQKAPFPLVMGTIVTERLLGTALVVLLLLVSLSYSIGARQYPAQSAWTVLGVAVALFAVLGLALLILFGLRDRIKGWLPARMAHHYENFHQGYLGSMRRIPWLTFWALLGWLAEIGRLYLVTLALGMELNLALVVFITLANSLLSLVPTPGGLGAVEPGVSGLLIRLSQLTAPVAGAVVLLDRAISYLSVIILGGLLFLVRQAHPREGRTPDILEAAEEEPS